MPPAEIGANCKISSHTFVCEGVTIEDGIFVGHGIAAVVAGNPANILRYLEPVAAIANRGR